MFEPTRHAMMQGHSHGLCIPMELSLVVCTKWPLCFAGGVRDMFLDHVYGKVLATSARKCPRHPRKAPCAREVGSMVSGKRALHKRMAALTAGMAFALAMPAHAASPTHAYPWNQPGCPCSTTLHEGSPAQAGLVPQALEKI